MPLAAGETSPPETDINGGQKKSGRSQCIRRTKRPPLSGNRTDASEQLLLQGGIIMMLDKLPGTALDFDERGASNAFSVIAPILDATGGLTLSQLATLTGPTRLPTIGTS